ncbi:N-6 DNA methylase [Candidatus Nitrosocaldus islandicus]|uniref:N-6 DNA methylase n=1 Tax=Candidatus Nitrosocaldus islandicus TaxID=2045011 RepID=UPI000CD0B842|nr:N-6 DNA methylase [Candidatus Nitrosocaldus islandicus]
MSLDIWDRLSKVEPQWVVRYYWAIYEEFRGEPFRAEDAENALKKKGLSIENIYNVLSPLQKVGLLTFFSDVRDPRVKWYQIRVNGDKAVRVPTRDELLKLMKSAADLIRTAVDYSVILLFVFYKAVSDKWEFIAMKHKAEGLSDEEAYILANAEYVKLYDENDGLLLTWSSVARKVDTIHEIERALVRVSELNRGLEELRVLLNRLGLTELAKGDKRSILVRLVELFNPYDFSNVSYDALGDAYQWMLGHFAPEKAKEGETYTPGEVIKLMVRLLDIEDQTTVLDPACGSCAMLIEAYNYVRSKVSGEPRLKLVGQDLNDVMVAVSKMNLLLHGISSGAQVYVGDSLENPRRLLEAVGEGGADYVITNVPWNQDGYDEARLGRAELRGIYAYGYPPKTTADWAWAQLILYLVKRRAAVVLDQGALFREGKEASIRSKVVDGDLIEAVILLPEKLFYNTQAPGIILLFNKEKPVERKGKMLFINASREYEPHPEVRRLNRLGEGHIEKIAKACREFATVEGFSKVVELDEIRKNGYNLNVTLYVAPLQEAEEIDIERELQDLMEVSKRAEEARLSALEYIQQILEARRAG